MTLESTTGIGGSRMMTDPSLNTNTDPNTQKLNTGDNTKVKEIVSKAMEIIAGDNVRVTRGGTTGVDGNADTSKTSGATGVPVLDNPDDEKALEANLEKLIAFLQLENEEQQTQMAKDRIELQKGKLDVEHEGRMKEIDETIAKMKKAEKAAMASRIFGWLGAIVAVVAAVVLTITTGGAAAGFAIAGAVLAVSQLVMSETGAMDKLTEALAEKLKDSFGKNAKLAAMLIINLSMIALSAGCGVGAMVGATRAVAQSAATAAKAGAEIAATTAASATSATAKTMSAGAKIATMVAAIMNTAVGAGSLATGGFATYYNKVAEDEKADSMEMEKFIAQLQQRLEESQEELQIILQQIQSAVGDIVELITSATDTSAEIANKIGQMA